MMKVFVLVCLIGLGAAELFSQNRVAVLPLRNMDGDISKNLWAEEIADSLRNFLMTMDGHGTTFVIVPKDSVEMAISELNLDPLNPQYESDVWKAIAALGVNRVIQGSFLQRHDRVLMNAYVYDTYTKMSNPNYEAKDIYKTPTTYLDAVRVIAKRLLPALKE